ncbi:MAG: aldo/keto reductase, partial [Deltaproteobacteria bacterium]|nr:aldo/keto reductase [Deltaproteobacteria bacterium]
MRVSDSASRLAIGTAQLGLPYGVSNTKGQVGRDEAFRILYAAATADIDTVDTARAYGTSEQVLGEAFARAGAGHFRVVTKISSLKGCAADVAPQLEASLRALGKGVVPDV